MTDEQAIRDFDGACMNPPFEDGQDIRHVMKARSLIQDGKPVIAIMSNGPFFRQDKLSTTFRERFESVGGEVVRDLPSGTFDHSDVTQRTGVASKLVRIRR